MSLFPFSTSQYASGVSSTSYDLDVCVQQLRNHAEDAVLFGWKTLLRHDLMTAYQDCCEEGWNGYDAEPITKQTILAGETLLELLPDNVMPPEVLPEPTGKISFAWRNAAGATLVIAVDSNSIAFAELIGSKKRYGEAKFLSALPDDMKKPLLDYFGWT
ncbi:MAG: hypothetical protein HW387_115 [Parachlamydiales bacterium]|nr:hypothetical protein [Parachlamydiales bacterium]